MADNRAQAPTFPPLLHVGMVVRDAERVAGAFERRGLRWLRSFDLPVEAARFRGEPAAFSARYTFVGDGATELELVQPLSGRSPYSEFLDAQGEGIHHLAYVVDSIDAHLTVLEADAPDLSLLLDVAVPNGVRFVYVAGSHHGALLELIQVPDEMPLYPEAD